MYGHEFSRLRSLREGGGDLLWVPPVPIFPPSAAPREEIFLGPEPDPNVHGPLGEPSAVTRRGAIALSAGTGGGMAVYPATEEHYRIYSPVPDKVRPWWRRILRRKAK